MLCDAFMFYNELDILELRLELLDEYGDRFVLVEAEV
jgi:beta-1,4-mannosyl-glycoprotein beta-1,4-N-acetylglucosaminyltransferase